MSIFLLGPLLPFRTVAIQSLHFPVGSVVWELPILTLCLVFSSSVSELTKRLCFATNSGEQRGLVHPVSGRDFSSLPFEFISGAPLTVSGQTLHSNSGSLFLPWVSMNRFGSFSRVGVLDLPSSWAGGGAGTWCGEYIGSCAG